MSTPLETISKDSTVMGATDRMREPDVSALVVPSHPRGIISSSDVLDAVAEGRNVSDLRVADVMTEDVETVSPDVYMEEVAAMATTYDSQQLPTVDDDDVGMLSSTDVTATLS